MLDVAAMPDGDDEDEQDIIVDLVDHPVVAGPDTPLAVPADEHLGAARPGLVRQQLDGRLDPAPCRRIQLAQLAHGCRRSDSGDRAFRQEPG